MEQVVFFGLKSGSLDTQNVCLKFIKMGVNGVPVAPHGLILGENEATPSRKLLKHLPDLKTAINITTITKKLPINRPSGRYVIYNIVIYNVK